MQENNYYVNLSVPSELPPPPRSWRDWTAPVLALGLSLLFWACFSAKGFDDAYGPGLGILALVLGYCVAVFLMLGPRWDTGGVCLMVISLCLAMCCALYCHVGFMILHCLLILLTAAMAAFRLSGQARAGFLTLAALPETMELSIFALFSRIVPPWKQILPRRGNTEKTVRVLIAVLISGALLAVVLSLLASADMVFGSFFEKAGRWLRDLSPGTALWKLLRTAAMTLFILSGLYFIRTEPRAEPKARAERNVQVIYFLLPSILLDGVYAVFCIVQLRYLFGGAEAAAMAGGWAEYARTGFFQLVAVAAINLTLCGIGADEGRFSEKGGAALRIAEGLMLALTSVILLSAARRMQLYILAYGMSILRLMTIWGMAAAAVGILLCAWKLVRPRAAFFPAFFGYALASWCLLCLLNPAGQTAKYNVNAYLDGRLPAVDMDYLEELTPDAAGAVKTLADSSEEYRAEALGLLSRWQTETETSWANWKAHLHE